MKPLIALLLATSLGSFNASAQQACNRELLQVLNERYAITLFCASLDRGFQQCLNTGFFGGFAALAVSNLFAIKQPHFSAEGFSKIMNSMSANAKNLIVTISNANEIQKVFLLPKLVEELKKQPNLHANQIKNLQSLMTLKSSRVFLAAAGILGMFGSLAIEMFTTSPEECKQLSFSDLDKSDNKWVVFGLNCSRHVNPDLFTLPIDQQVAILERSPGLCEAVTKHNEDLRRKAEPPTFNADDFIHTTQ